MRKEVIFMANLSEKIKSNAELVAQLKNKLEQGKPNYEQFKASINALELNNEIMADLVKTMEGEASTGEALARVYAILQSLFVSIDALYSLNIILTGFKNYININQNRQIRELKYIRNDVIGHPVNRMYENKEVGYCTLKTKDISKKSFVYYVYLPDTTKKREVKIVSLIDSFYDEANKLLGRLVVYKDADKSEVKDKLKKILIKLSADEEVRDDMLQLRGMYLSKNPQQTKTDVRFMWRIELFMNLRKNIDPKDKELKEIINYACGHQLEGLYKSMLSEGETDKAPLVNKMKEPKGLAQFDKLVSTSPELAAAADHLHDMTHPLFAASLTKIMDACTKDYPYALKYLSFFKTFYDAQDADMVYALGVILKNHRK